MEKGEFAQDLLEEVPPLEDRDRALLTQIVYGVIRQHGALDKLIQTKISHINRLILRIAGFQLFFLSKIPQYAIVNESVELAKKVSSKKSAGFINAVIRNWCRNPPKMEDEYSHPQWIVERWIKLFGKKETEKLCNFNNEIPPVYIRINTLKDIPVNVMEQFEKTAHPHGYKIISKGPIKDLIGFKEGLFHVQDISSMFIVDLLDVKPGMRVLDLCASPGGKTCSIAEIMENKGEIIAVDISKEKIRVIEDNCNRLGINIVKTEIGDGTKIKLGSFDRILVDAPCSNTGVFGRRVEARWRLKPNDFKRHSEMQLALLTNAKEMLTLDGKLVYSTCSIDPEEDENIVSKFLDNHKKFILTKAIRKFPFDDNMDGVYGAVLMCS
jgi:16S rRNA (cytosine967-C5)-methyltransferase